MKDYEFTIRMAFDEPITEAGQKIVGSRILETLVHACDTVGISPEYTFTREIEVRCDNPEKTKFIYIYPL